MSDTRAAARCTFAGLALDALVRGDVQAALTYAEGWASLPDENGRPLPEQDPATRPSPRGYSYLSDQKLLTVATVYRDAMAKGDAPTQAVADHFARPRSTAGRWVAEARRAGFLGTTRQGAAGEFAGETSA